MAKDVKDMTPEERYLQYRTGTPDERKAAEMEIERLRREKEKQQDRNKAAQDLNVK